MLDSGIKWWPGLPGFQPLRPVDNRVLERNFRINRVRDWQVGWVPGEHEGNALSRFHRHVRERGELLAARWHWGA